MAPPSAARTRAPARMGGRAGVGKAARQAVEGALRSLRGLNGASVGVPAELRAVLDREDLAKDLAREPLASLAKKAAAEAWKESPPPPLAPEDVPAERVDALFKKFDTDGSKTLDVEEVAHAIGLSIAGKALGPSKTGGRYLKAARELLFSCDKDGDGYISETEFLDLLRLEPFSAMLEIEKMHAVDIKRPSEFRSRAHAGYNATRPIELDVKVDKVLKAGAKAEKNYIYEGILEELQVELVALQEYIKKEGLKVLVIFEGRDAAGKGGVISRIASAMSPRVTRICALAAPTEKERSQWYFQRYVANLPSAGEMVLFDRSWYNRAGVERVMGFCTDAQYEQFMATVGPFEEMLVDSGIILLKYWLDVSDEEQALRFNDRLRRSWKRWKLSPMDPKKKWSEYALAQQEILSKTSSEKAPWTVVPANDKKLARLNCIQHLLASIDYDVVIPEAITIPPRDGETAWDKVVEYIASHDAASSLDHLTVPQVYTKKHLSLGRKVKEHLKARGDVLDSAQWSFEEPLE